MTSETTILLKTVLSLVINPDFVPYALRLLCYSKLQIVHYPSCFVISIKVWGIVNPIELTDGVSGASMSVQRVERRENDYQEPHRRQQGNAQRAKRLRSHFSVPYIKRDTKINMPCFIGRKIHHLITKATPPRKVQARDFKSYTLKSLHLAIGTISRKMTRVNGIDEIQYSASLI